MNCPICKNSLERFAEKVLKCTGIEHHIFIEGILLNKSHEDEECLLIVVNKKSGMPESGAYKVKCRDLPS